MKKKKAAVQKDIERIGTAKFELFEIAVRLSDQDRNALLKDHVSFLTKVFKDPLKSKGVRKINDLILGDKLRQEMESRLKKTPAGIVTVEEPVVAHIITKGAHFSKVVIIG
jgi:hypothetical protein